MHSEAVEGEVVQERAIISGTLPGPEPDYALEAAESDYALAQGALEAEREKLARARAEVERLAKAVEELPADAPRRKLQHAVLEHSTAVVAVRKLELAFEKKEPRLQAAIDEARERLERARRNVLHRERGELIVWLQQHDPEIGAICREYDRVIREKLSALLQKSARLMQLNSELEAEDVRSRYAAVKLQDGIYQYVPEPDVTWTMDSATGTPRAIVRERAPMHFTTLAHCSYIARGE